MANSVRVISRAQVKRCLSMKDAIALQRQFNVVFDGPDSIGMHVLGKGGIASVAPGSLADQAGVTSNHVIKAINGRPIGVSVDEQILVQMLRVRPVEVTFWRKHSPQQQAKQGRQGSPSIFRRPRK